LKLLVKKLKKGNFILKGIYPMNSCMKLFTIKSIFSNLPFQKLFSILFILIFSFAFSKSIIAGEITVSSISDLNSAIVSANGGDVIILKNGIYTGSAINFINSRGSAGKKIVVKAETPGGVVINGDSTSVLMRGDHLVLTGFHFKDVVGNGVFLGIEDAGYWRVTNCKFENINKTGGVIEVRGLSSSHAVYSGPSKYGRIDHSTFERNRRIEIEIFIIDKENYIQPDLDNTHNTIDHNVFKDHIKATQEEAIQIGRGTIAWGPDGKRGRIAEYTTDAYTTIEYNLFQNYHGDNELISSKCSSNTIQYNVVIDSGTITQRMGDDAVIKGNWFFFSGNPWEQNGIAIRANGKNHKIINNYVENYFTPIALYFGEEGTSYPPVANAMVANNTIVNSHRNTIYIGFGSEKGSVAPDNTYIANNIIYGVSPGQKCILEMTASTNTTYETNIAWPINGEVGVSNPEIIEVDPNLKYDGKMYRLQSSSSNAINRGTPSSSVTTDIDGQERTLAPDIGADEYSSLPIKRSIIKEEIGGSGVQWPNSTLEALAPPTGFRVVL
jgi:poly(beta-D-mannuronate) lyase